MILKQKNETQTKICIYNYLELKVRIEEGFTTIWFPQLHF